ncbi:hypothetical protein [Ursidibacter sp. B-7004-1]
MNELFKLFVLQATSKKLLLNGAISQGYNRTVRFYERFTFR